MHGLFRPLLLGWLLDLVRVGGLVMLRLVAVIGSVPDSIGMSLLLVVAVLLRQFLLVMLLDLSRLFFLLVVVGVILDLGGLGDADRAFGR